MLKDAINDSMMLNDSPAAYNFTTDGDVDLALLNDSLAMSPWERMQANDAALNFADSLRTAMEKRHAKS